VSGVVVAIHLGMILWKLGCGTSAPSTPVGCCGQVATPMWSDRREPLEAAVRHTPSYAFEGFQGILE
jgi:hypothetical protein